MTIPARVDALGRHRDALGALLDEIARDRATHDLDREFLSDLRRIEQHVRVAHGLSQTAINHAMRQILEHAQEQASHNLQVDR